MAESSSSGGGSEWQRAQQGVRVSVDLVAAAQQQLRLLHAVDCCAGLYSGPAVRRAIRRYERCWLPLLDELQGGRQLAGASSSSNSNRSGEAELPSFLVPPLDVHWIWLCHRLAPDAYARDCTAMFSRVLNCPLPLLDPSAAAASSSFSSSFSSTTPSSLHSPHSPSTLSPSSSSAHSHPFLLPSDQQQMEAVAVSRRIWNERWPGDPYDLHFFQKSGNAAAGAAASLASLHLPPSLLGSSSFRSLASPPLPASPGAAAGPGGSESRGDDEAARAETASVQERISYDLEAAVARQAQFFHQIARPHMQDAKYLLGAVERYKAFLWLAKHKLPAAHDNAAAAAAGAADASSAGGGGGSGASGMFVPALDIDFVWHAHQLAPLAYAHDCNALLGRLLSHHDSLPDHHEPPTTSDTPPSSSSLSSALQSTAATWLQFYGRPYARAGTIRKDPPPPPFPFPPPLKSKSVGGGGGAGGSGSGSIASGASSGPGSLIPSGSSSRGTSKITSPVSSPGASPIQDMRGDLRGGIPPRHVFDACLSLLSVSSLPSSLKGDLSLQISSLSACPSLRLRSLKLPLPLSSSPSPSSSSPSASTPALPPNEHPWPNNPTWWLTLDAETKGVVLQLFLEPPKGRLSGIAGMAGMTGAHKARSLGEATVLWGDVFAARDLTWHGTVALALGAAGSGKGAPDHPHVRIHVTVTPPQPAPALLLLHPAVGTDDSGLQLTAAAVAALKQQQEGRWMARTVLDHTLAERFVLRIRVAKGHGSQQVEVPAESKRVLLHRGGWSPSPKVKGGLVAAGERVDEVCQLKSHHMASQRTWMAYSGWTLQVTLRHPHLPSSSSLPSTVSFPSSSSLSSSSSSSSASSSLPFPGLRFQVAKMPGPPMALAPGRRLAYYRSPSSLSSLPSSSSASALLRSSSTAAAAAAAAHGSRGRARADGACMGGEGEDGEDAEGEEAGYVTVVRYPEDCPGGVATALFNWRTGGIEVQPHERLDVVVLMAVAVAQSWHDLHLAASTSAVAKKKAATPVKSTPSKITPSKLPRHAASVGKDDRWGSVVVNPSPAGAMSADPPLYDWFMSRMLMWHDSPLYNASDVGGSCAALLGGSACGAM
ncbi:hypothetical protein CLOM_g14956 [Closterium sp. NIES-68]|nr:hypothetical protein CLOM_g14956 [Closterium sp. NIES-68]GJP70099.1 hypothetical protein CLOP_g1084 [Closterium sp. NIES-67]